MLFYKSLIDALVDAKRTPDTTIIPVFYSDWSHSPDWKDYPRFVWIIAEDTYSPVLDVDMEIARTIEGMLSDNEDFYRLSPEQKHELCWAARYFTFNTFFEYLEEAATKAKQMTPSGTPGLSAIIPEETLSHYM